MTFGFQCDEDTSRAILDTAFEAGITFVDTADAYPLGSEYDDPPKNRAPAPLAGPSWGFACG